MRGGHDGGRPIRPSLWCRRDESYIFSDFLRRNAGTNSTAGTSFDFLAGFTAFIRHLLIVGTNFVFRGPAHHICPPHLVGNIVRRNYIQNIWREEVNTRMYP